ncbi:unnamed protein product, partial [Pocillopora meandrina]
LLDSLKDSDSLAVDLSYPSVRGRLGEFVDFWRTLEVSQFVLNVIMQGYKIPFFQLPTPFAKRNNTSARGTDFVSAKVNSLVVHSDLLKSGFVPNEVKSLWEPVQVITWLGVVLDTTDGTIKATDERIEKLNAGL